MRTITRPNPYRFRRPPCQNLGCYHAESEGNNRMRWRYIIESMSGGFTSEHRSNQDWIAQYATSHQHPVNRFFHTLGIPTILVSIPVLVASFFFHRLWLYALTLFVIGWILQFIGHAFEGKRPEFLHDWRFLFVGVRWWWAKINGKA
jgi:hypothetical protein